MMNRLLSLPLRYLSWLQKDNPAGVPDRFPELTKKYETSVPGLYCVGDLTGIPLIKLAVESGHELIEKLADDPAFNKGRTDDSDDIYDLIIVGGGPSGIAASLRAQERGIHHLVLEAARMFNTIENFPAGKPVYVTPENQPFVTALRFGDGTKESLLDDLRACVADKNLPVRTGMTVTGVTKEGDGFSVQTPDETFRSRKVIIAIGKSGNARRLKVPGEELPKVYSRLVDPGEFQGKDILVAGGGDSALEAAVALAKSGNRVTVSYRKGAFTRPREENLRAFNAAVTAGTIVPFFSSTIAEIDEDAVILKDQLGEHRIPNQVVFVLIGSEIPKAFFRRANIRIAGEMRFVDFVKAVSLLLFASVLYFGKKAPVTPVTSASSFFSVPSRLMQMAWPGMVNGIIAWSGFLLLGFFFVILAIHGLRQWKRYFSTLNDGLKYGFFIMVLLLVMVLYPAYKLAGKYPVFRDMGGWYTILYSLTVLVFGIRRMVHTRTGYVARQTLILILIQIIPLCVLPMFVLPALGDSGVLGDWLMHEVFPGKSYWRAYGLILAWPLFIHNIATGNPVTFWFVLGMAQTFLIIPYSIYRWGKGAYCGWVCSCGALAETLGDDYRTRAPHGIKAKRWENAGQLVLLFAIAVTVIAILAGKSGGACSRTAQYLYALSVDIILAGVLGVGVYFFMSGRVWCRFFCPLAALMHIYARFSRYRIFADKKRCISCSICTNVCHMGIDVMGYANRGVPMNDVECVRCSACVVSCPMRVLSFGALDRPDTDNRLGGVAAADVDGGWGTGLPLVKEQTGGAKNKPA